MALDWNKPLVTRAGLPCRLLGVILPKEKKFSRICAVTDVGGREYVISVTEEGQFSTMYGPRKHPDDVLNQKVKKTYWVNVYKPGNISYAYDTEEKAIRSRDAEHINFLGTFPIEVEEDA